MPNEYYPGADQVVGVMIVIMIIYLLFLLAMLALAVTAYVLGSLGMSTVAERRGIRNSWLAWIPLGNLWILGSISDQYQYLVKGKVKNRRRSMLVLSVAAMVLYVVFFFASIVATMLGEGPFLAMFIAIFGFFAATVALTVLEYMCYYDYFRSCEKGNGALYLLLTIFVPVVAPFLVFGCRKKDEGMPPRKQPAAPAAEEPVVEPPVVEPPVVEPPVVEPPVVEPPVVEPPVVEPPVVEPPVVEPPVVEPPVVEPPVVEPPVVEPPVVEPPVVEPPVVEPPVVEVPAEEKPVEEIPAQPAETIVE